MCEWEGIQRACECLYALSAAHWSSCPMLLRNSGRVCICVCLCVLSPACHLPRPSLRESVDVHHLMLYVTFVIPKSLHLTLSTERESTNLFLHPTEVFLKNAYPVRSVNHLEYICVFVQTSWCSSDNPEVVSENRGRYIFQKWKLQSYNNICGFVVLNATELSL